MLSDGELNMPVLDKIGGRFAQILPPKVATAKHRMVAKAMQKVEGVNFNAAPSLNLSRFSRFSRPTSALHAQAHLC